MNMQLISKISNYAKVNSLRSAFEVAISMVLYGASIATVAVCYFQNEYWAYVLSAVLLGLTTVRMFCLQHDCGHNSLFKKRRTNRWVGILLGYLIFVPHYYWTKKHAIHHASTNQLDRSTVGGVEPLTPDEYYRLSWLNKAAYRVERNLFLLITVGAVFFFFAHLRYVKKKCLIKTIGLLP